MQSASPLTMTVTLGPRKVAKKAHLHPSQSQQNFTLADKAAKVVAQKGVKPKGKPVQLQAKALPARLQQSASQEAFAVTPRTQIGLVKAQPQFDNSHNLSLTVST